MKLRYVVVGSAPGVIVPEMRRMDFVVAANGGVQFVPRVDVLFTTAYLCRPNPLPHELATLEAWRGRYIHLTFVDLRDGALAQVIETFRRYDVHCHDFFPVSPTDRDVTVRAACGLPLGEGPAPDRVSTGVFAVCQSFVMGASDVIICGVSLDKVGHQGLEGSFVGDHINGDRECLAALRRRYGGRLTSTSPDLEQFFREVEHG